MDRRWWVVVLGLLSVAWGSGCGPTTYPVFRGGAFAKLERRVPLEQGEHALVDPVDDASILGKIVNEPYDQARPLADQVSENPCASELTAATREASALGETMDAEPTRGAYFYFRVRVLRRLEMTAGANYEKCCAEKGCGVGFVRSLAFGDGEVSFASATLPGGRADVALDDADAPLELELGNVRRVHGYVAFALASTSFGGPPAVLPSEPPRPSADADYLADRFEVRDVPGNADQYAFCTQTDCVSENGFVQRYRERTGSHELDDFDRDRARDARVAGAILSVLGVASLALGVAAIETADEGKTRDDQDGMRVAGGIGLGTGIVTSAIGLTLLIEPRDGSPFDHFISKVDAKRFVLRFNRSLLLGKDGAKGAPKEPVLAAPGAAPSTPAAPSKPST